MKYECGIIRDLLPLCQDNAASDKSRAAVDEHLAECAECREYGKESIRREKSPDVPAAPNNETAGYVALARK